MHKVKIRSGMSILSSLLLAAIPFVVHASTKPDASSRAQGSNSNPFARHAMDAVALNAGVGAGGDFVRETALDDDLNVIDLNVRSTVHLAKLVLKDMVQNGQGRVLFTSSTAATMPGTFNAVYSASKAFIQSFAQAIRNG